jgi:DNA-binding IscR family transcriptional regulator
MTKASEYALLSLIVLAKAGHPLDADTLSRELDISKSFLYNLFSSSLIDFGALYFIQI